jgi:hypothetical protein
MSTVLWLSPAIRTPLWLVLEALGQQTVGTLRLTARTLLQTVGSQALTVRLVGRLVLARAGLVVLVVQRTKGIPRHTARLCTAVAAVAVRVGIVALVERVAITRATARPPLARREPQELAGLVAVAVVALAALTQPQTIKSMRLVPAATAAALALRALGLAEPAPLELSTTAAKP